MSNGNGATLFERLRGKRPEVLETLLLNPLDARIGAFFTINTIEYDGLQFTLRAIYEYTRQIGGQTFKFVDYELYAQRDNSSAKSPEDVWVRVRINPQPNVGPASTCLLLTLTDSLAFDEGLEACFNDPTGTFCINDGPNKGEYHRLNGITDPYTAQVTSLADDNGDGQVSREEVKKNSLRYWDYSRDAQRPGGATFEQFLFGEIDQTDGWTQLWIGADVPLSRVTIFQEK